MIKTTNVETFGWETAIRGMRNPMNNWDKSDSGPCSTHAPDYCCDCEYGNTFCNGFKIIIGQNDFELMLKLSKSGSDHAKFRRMINVTMDILAPLYWWKEFDTYKVGTVANSTSTMHKIHAKEFTLDDFSHEHLTNWQDPECAEFVNDYCSYYGVMDGSAFPLIIPYATDLLTLIVERLNIYRKLYVETNKKYTGGK